MKRPALVLLGEFVDDVELLAAGAEEFGWRIAVAQSLHEMARLCEDTHVVGVLRQADEPGEYCDMSSRGSRVRTILCGRAAHHLNQADLESCRAYDCLLLPARLSEVRTSLGFLAQAVRRELGPSAREAGSVLPESREVKFCRRENNHVSPYRLAHGGRLSGRFHSFRGSVE